MTYFEITRLVVRKFFASIISFKLALPTTLKLKIKTLHFNEY